MKKFILAFIGVFLILSSTIPIKAEELNEKNLDKQLHDVDGILVPGGFGNRGTEGMILAAQYARVHKILIWT